MEEQQERETGDSGGPGAGSPRGPRPRNPNVVFLLIAFSLLAFVWLASNLRSPSEISYPFFLEQIRNDPKNLLRLELAEERATGIFNEPPPQPEEVDREGKKVVAEDKSGNRKRYGKNFEVVIPRNDSSRRELLELLQSANIPYRLTDSGGSAVMIFEVIVILLSIGMFVFFWFQFRRTRDQLMGGGFLTGFTKSPAKRYEGVRQPVTFKDVAGLEGVKGDLMEIVDFLKNPQKFQRLGGRIPKGVLLNGPPGTGKTLLARAVAGEAGVPYFSVSGSEFIQMFVGVGASRVRDLFKTAKDSAPAIIFIDEIDAVGRQRGAGLGGGHDEREQTLNQILSEMDGFTQSEAVIVLAATNRPDVLDPALLRPGRFDRHITVGRPTQRGRVEIFKVHVRDVPLAADVDLERLAAATIGLTGADIRNIVNEAALWAARNNKTQVDASDFEHARDKVLMGAKREEVLQEKEKEKTAYHEAGHTLCAWRLPGAHRVHKVTIIPRGRSLGSTQTLPSEDRLSMSESEIRDHLVVMLGGRAAEKIIYHETTVGAENDLERATDLARHMVTHWGMSERLGPVSYKTSDDDPFLGREIHRQRQVSERTMQLIDEEVASILLAAQSHAQRLLTEQRNELEALTARLLRDEELDEREIGEVIGPSVHQPVGSSATTSTSGESAPSGSTSATAPAASPAVGDSPDRGPAGESTSSGG